MVGIFKRLFGGSASDETPRARSAHEQPKEKSRPDPNSETFRVSDPSLPGGSYFAQLERLTACISAKNYPEAATAARASLPLLREWLRDPAGDGLRLDIRIPALSQGGTMMAITGDRDGLSDLRALVQEFDFLEKYREEADEHFIDLDLFNRIRDV